MKNWENGAAYMKKDMLWGIPAGNYELKISGNRPVTRSGGFLCPGFQKIWKNWSRVSGQCLTVL